MIKVFKITTYKTFEIQTGRWKEHCPYFDFQFRWSRKCDHAGLRLGMELFGLHLYLELYDTRHWNYDNNKWCEYDNQ